MKKLKRAIAAMILATVGTGAVLAAPASAAPEPTMDRPGRGTVYITTGRTVTVFTEQPGQYTTYLVQTGNKGEEFAYSAVVEGGGDGSVPGTADIELRWKLCSHPATLTIVQRVFDGFDELGQAIYLYPVVFTNPHWTGGFHFTQDGRPTTPACGEDRN